MANNSLGKLGYAVGLHNDTTGNTQTSLNDVGGGQYIQIKMSQFMASFSTTLNPNWNRIRLGVSRTWNLVTTSAGSRFANDIGGQTRNASWYESTGQMTLTSNAGIYGTFINNNGVGDPTDIALDWNDYYNASVTATDSITPDA